MLLFTIRSRVGCWLSSCLYPAFVRLFVSCVFVVFICWWVGLCLCILLVTLIIKLCFGCLGWTVVLLGFYSCLLFVGCGFNCLCFVGFVLVGYLDVGWLLCVLLWLDIWLQELINYVVFVCVDWLDVNLCCIGFAGGVWMFYVWSTLDLFVVWLALCLLCCSLLFVFLFKWFGYLTLWSFCWLYLILFWCDFVWELILV